MISFLDLIPTMNEYLIPHYGIAGPGIVLAIVIILLHQTLQDLS